MPLSNVQQYFLDYIFDAEKDEIKSTLVSPPAGTIADRLAVYADAYEGRLVDALEKIFPVLEKQIGDELFYDLCVEYIYTCPQSYFSISYIGEQFSIFLKNKELILPADLAALELAMHIATEAADGKVFTQEMLQSIPQEKWGDIIFEIAPSLQVISASYDVISLYQSLKNKNKKISKVKKAPIVYKVWQKDLHVNYVVMNTEEHCFLSHVQEKLSFGEICEKLMAHMPEEDIGNYAVTQLLTWMQDKVITGVKVLS